MPSTANPKTRRAPYRLTALAALAACSLATACSNPTADQPGWRHVSSAPEAADPSAKTATTRSLGDPFVIVANSDPGYRLVNSMNPDSLAVPTAEVQSAWAMLASDACDVELSSMNVAIKQRDSVAWLTTVQSTRGIVLDASPHHAIVRYETMVRVDRESGWSSGQAVPATVDLEARMDGDRVWMHVRLTAESIALRLEFAAVGAFDQDPEVIPDRRLACPH